MIGYRMCTQIQNTKNKRPENVQVDEPECTEMKF